MNKTVADSMGWDFRSQILDFSHRWPLIILAFLLGGLIGVGVSFLLPPAYRAESGLAVVYNADVYPNNPDDFKNWYLEQLDLFIRSDGVLDDTLGRLQQMDARWDGTTRPELREMLHAYWRSAGQWRLVATTPDAESADQLARAWKDAVLSQVAAATGQAASMLSLANQHQQVARLEAETQQRIGELAGIRAALQVWVDSHPASGLQAPLPPAERWRLLSLASRVSELHETELSLLAAAPAENAPTDAYLPWLDQVLASLDSQANINQAQLAMLINQRTSLEASWQAASLASHGLSAYLLVTELPAVNQPAQPVRRASAMALVGGIVGVLALALFWLARLPRKVSR